MYQQIRGRRFRRRPNDRAGFSHGNGNAQGRLRSHSFSNEQTRNKFREISKEYDYNRNVRCIITTK